MNTKRKCERNSAHESCRDESQTVVEGPDVFDCAGDGVGPDGSAGDSCHFVPGLAIRIAETRTNSRPMNRARETADWASPFANGTRCGGVVALMRIFDRTNQRKLNFLSCERLTLIAV